MLYIPWKQNGLLNDGGGGGKSVNIVVNVGQVWRPHALYKV